MAEPARLFQQRHALQHAQGIVDQDYLEKSGDTSYALGQRIVMREPAVVHLADLLSRLVSGMRSDLPAKRVEDVEQSAERTGLT